MGPLGGWKCFTATSAPIHMPRYTEPFEPEPMHSCSSMSFGSSSLASNVPSQCAAPSDDVPSVLCDPSHCDSPNDDALLGALSSEGTAELFRVYRLCAEALGCSSGRCPGSERTPAVDPPTVEPPVELELAVRSGLDAGLTVAAAGPADVDLRVRLLCPCAPHRPPVVAPTPG